jgi:hypothetical protein
MSNRSFIEGVLEFETTEQLKQAVQPLRKGGWLTTNNKMLLGDEGEADEGVVCIKGNQFTIPPGVYRNLSSHTNELIAHAKKGFLNLNSDDGDLGFSIWNNGREINAWDNKAIWEFLDDEIQKDLIILDEDEFEEKHEGKGIDFWESRYSAFEEAFDNAVWCFQSEEVALTYIKDKKLAKAIHTEERWIV